MSLPALSDEPEPRSYGKADFAHSIRMRREHMRMLQLLEDARATEERAKYARQMRAFDEKRGKVTQVAEKPVRLPDTDQIRTIDTQEVKAIRFNPPVVTAFKQEIERAIGSFRNDRGYLPGYIAMSPANRIWLRKHFPEQLKDCFRILPANIEIAYYVDDDLDDLSFYCM